MIENIRLYGRGSILPLHAIMSGYYNYTKNLNLKNIVCTTYDYLSKPLLKQELYDINIGYIHKSFSVKHINNRLYDKDNSIYNYINKYNVNYYCRPKSNEIIVLYTKSKGITYYFIIDHSILYFVCKDPITTINYKNVIPLVYFCKSVDNFLDVLNNDNEEDNMFRRTFLSCDTLFINNSLMFDTVIKKVIDKIIQNHLEMNAYNYKFNLKNNIYINYMDYTQKDYHNMIDNCITKDQVLNE